MVPTVAIGEHSAALRAACGQPPVRPSPGGEMVASSSHPSAETTWRLQPHQVDVCGTVPVHLPVLAVVAGHRPDERGHHAVSEFRPEGWASLAPGSRYGPLDPPASFPFPLQTAPSAPHLHSAALY